MFWQIYILRGDTGNPGNGRWVIPVVRKEEKRSETKNTSSHLCSSQAIVPGFIYVCGAPLIPHPAIGPWLLALAHYPAPPLSPPYAVPSPLSYSSDFLGERKSSSWSFMSSIFMYLAPSVPKSSSPSENNMPKRANRSWSGWWHSTGEREKENETVNELLEGLDNMTPRMMAVIFRD